MTKTFYLSRRPVSPAAEHQNERQKNRIGEEAGEDRKGWMGKKKRLTEPTPGPLHHAEQLPLDDTECCIGPRPGTDEAELGVEVGAHGPRERAAPARPGHHVRERRRGAQVERELEGVALVVHPALGLEQVVAPARVQRVVELVGRDDGLDGHLVARGRLEAHETVAVAVLQEAVDPELGLELGKGRDCT